MSSATQAAKNTSSVDWAALILLALTLLVRGGALAKFKDRLGNDPDKYYSLAKNVYFDGTFGKGANPTAYRPPLYPMLLVPCVSLETWRERSSYPAIAALHLLLGLATVQLMLWLGRIWGRALGLSDLWAFLAALLVLCDPILINQSTLVMNETLATFLAVLALAALTRAGQTDSTAYSILSGGAIGLAILCRPTFMVWLIVVMIGLLWTAREKARGLLNAAMLLLAAGLVLAPWIIRNYKSFGQPIATTTHGGYTLLLGNNPGFYAWLRSPGDTVWQAAQFDVNINERREKIAPGDEVQHDQAEYGDAIGIIRGDPAMFLRACLFRLASLWGVLPNSVDGLSQQFRYPVAGFYLLEYLLAIFGLWALGKRLFGSPWLWGLLLVISFTAVHTVYWSNMRMRAPLVPFVALLASVGAARILSKSSAAKEIPAAETAGA